MKEQSIAHKFNHMGITRFHQKVTAVVGIGMFFDIFDIFLAGVLATVLAKQFHVSSAALPLIIGSGFLGMFLGSIFLSGLADKMGRRKAYLFNLSTYSLFTLLGAFSGNAAMLIVFRFLAGFGIGAELPLSDTYLSEILPAAQRGRYISWAYTLSFVAIPVVGFAARGLVPAHPLGLAGWRWLFIIGALGAVIVWFLRRSLPESPRWLELQGRHQEAEEIFKQFESSGYVGVQSPVIQEETDLPADTKLPVRVLFGPIYIKRTLMLYVFQILQSVGYYGFGTLVPVVLATKGYTVTHTLLYTALSFIGYPVGSLLSLPIVERIDRKWLIVISAFFMGVFGMAFGFSGSPGMIVLFGFIYTLVSNVFSNALHIFQAEIFPTSVRATAAGSAYSLSRLASGALPFVLLPVLKQYGSGAMFGVVGIAMLILMIDVAAFGPKTTGRPLESVNEISINA